MIMLYFLIFDTLLYLVYKVMYLVLIILDIVSHHIFTNYKRVFVTTVLVSREVYILIRSENILSASAYDEKRVYLLLA